MLNKLRGDPVIRKHYQFWFYSYPTGYPFRHNADERAAVRPTSDRVTVNLPLCLLCCRRRRDSGPFCKQTIADGQQGWPDEHADETKNQCAAQHAEENQDEWQITALADEPRFDHVIHAADRDSPRQHENSPAGRTLMEEPD